MARSISTPFAMILAEDIHGSAALVSLFTVITGLVGGLTALLLAQGGVQATVLDAAPVLDVEKTLSVMNPRVLAL
ncbi:LrgB family protein, partial [Acinetobacter nosocomialis]|uniref:LrgB family protein n=1 Tax=Acinetobacter nosocomialis TaxID=106654 RepID=UPI00148F0AA7